MICVGAHLCVCWSALEGRQAGATSTSSLPEWGLGVLTRLLSCCCMFCLFSVSVCCSDFVAVCVYICSFSLRAGGAPFTLIGTAQSGGPQVQVSYAAVRQQVVQMFSSRDSEYNRKNKKKNIYIYVYISLYI